MDGMNDIQSEGNYGSWNVSATMGPLGRVVKGVNCKMSDWLT